MCETPLAEASKSPATAPEKELDDVDHMFAGRPQVMRASSASCWSVDTLGHLSRYVMSKVVLIRPACHLCFGRAYNGPVFYGQSPTRFRSRNRFRFGPVQPTRCWPPI